MSWTVLAYSEVRAEERRLPIPQEVHDYYATQFKPKYRQEECLVRIDYEMRENSYHLRFEYIDITVHNYIVNHEPYMAAVTISQPPVGQRIYLQFMDFCEKRYELAAGIANEIVKKNAEVLSASASNDIITDTKEIGTDQSTGIYLSD